MADKKDFEIALKTVATGDGAEKTERAVKKIETAAKTATGHFRALASAIVHPVKAMGELSKRMGSFKQLKLARETLRGMAKDTHGVNAVVALTQGNFEGVKNSILSAIENTKRWQATVKKVGVGRAAAGMTAIGTAMSTVVAITGKWVERLREATREMRQQRIDGIGGGVDAASSRMNAWDQAAERQARLRRADRDAEFARLAGRRTSMLAFDSIRTNQELLGVRDPSERNRINLEHARRVEDASFEEEQQNLLAEEQDRKDKLRDAIERKNQLKKGRIRIESLSRLARQTVDDIQGELPEESSLAEMLQGIADTFGASYAEDAKKGILEAADKQKAINDVIADIAKRSKDIDVEIEELEIRGKSNAYKKENLSYRYNEVLSARSVEDQERQRGYDLQNTMRANELKERARQEAEDDAQAELEFAMQRMSHAEKIAALNERRAVRERELANIESELAKLAGIREENLSEEQKAERARLEARRSTLVGQVRADRNAARDMEWTGDTEAYGRYRQYETELRGEAESDYQMLRQWRERRLGAAGRLGGARNEMGRQQGRLAEAQSQLDYLVQQVKNRNGGEFSYESMTPEERARFNDLRSDVQSRRGDVRSATGAYMDALQERAMKDVEFRGGLVESNRLTALGLAGGGELQWGVDTAKNTEEMVRLMKELSDKVGNARTETDSATFGF